MPKRGPHGEFMRRDASSDAQRGFEVRVPGCGTEHEELMVAVRGGRVKIIYCPRCAPEPLESIRGE
jgi:hypothetical protein